MEGGQWSSLWQEANPQAEQVSSRAGQGLPSNFFYLDTQLDYISQTPLLPGIAM